MTVTGKAQKFIMRRAVEERLRPEARRDSIVWQEPTTLAFPVPSWPRVGQALAERRVALAADLLRRARRTPVPPWPRSDGPAVPVRSRGAGGVDRRGRQPYCCLQDRLPTLVPP